MGNHVSPEVCVHPDLASLSRAAAERLGELALKAVAERSCFALGLAGGNTPRKLYQILAEAYREHIPWSEVHLFWGDERCVPPDHPESNFGMAYETLISKIQIPPHQVHRIPVELDTPERAAEAYEITLREFLGHTSPVLDLVLLGVGADGHTASLFPGDSVLEEQGRWVKPVHAPLEYATRRRVTLTLPVLNRASYMFLLVSGTEKQKVVQTILRDPKRAREWYPAAMTRSSGRGGTVWFLDEAALGRTD